MKILIIDDSPSVRKTVAWKLKNIGHEIIGMGGDGREGLELFKRLSPELVILDVTMPNMDGRECLKELLTLDPGAKVVMLSAASTSEIIQECLSIGAIAFLDKNQMMAEKILEAQISEILKGLHTKAA